MEYNYIDLELPSGTLWCDRNLGASESRSLGNYYAWKESYQKDNYTLQNYYLTNGSDTAQFVLSGGWRMPTYDDVQELIKFCQIIDKGEFYIFKRRKYGAELIIPKAGMIDGLFLDTSKEPLFWTSTPFDSDKAYYCVSRRILCDPVLPKYVGLNIRPVCSKQV